MGAQDERRESETGSTRSPRNPSQEGETGLWRADRSEVGPQRRSFPNVRATAG